MGIAKILPKRHDLNMTCLTFFIGNPSSVEGDRRWVVLWYVFEAGRVLALLQQVIRRRDLKIFVSFCPLLTSNVGQRPAYNIVEARPTGREEKDRLFGKYRKERHNPEHLAGRGPLNR